MPFDTYSFLVVGLVGFMAVWTFRWAAKRKDKLSEFEYLGLSAFWGLSILMWCVMLQGGDSVSLSNLDKLFKDPYSSGFLFSILGALLGSTIGLAVRFLVPEIKKITKKKRSAS